VAAAADMRERIATFCWVDVFGGAESERKNLLTALGLEGAEVASALRFGQAGRMVIGQQHLRAVTWLADPGGTLTEIHLLGTQQRIVTVWSGDAAALEEVRQHFADRVGAVARSPYQAAGMLLQLLLGTLDHAVRDIDSRLDNLRVELDRREASAIDLTPLAAQRRELQSAWINFDRYSSAVRAATVGIEAVAGVDPRGAAELNDYADQVEDLEEQLLERRRWMSEIMHDFSTAIVQRQGEQINRLTLVSLIFLPVTAVTGFFGMNFNWMIGELGSAAAFFGLGVLLPAAMMLVTVGWFIRRGFIEFRRKPASTGATSGNRRRS
jgi:Mg2+ and Co2+ transporter CorA